MKALLQNNPMSEEHKILIAVALNKLAIKLNPFRDGVDKKFVDACKNAAESFERLSKTLETLKRK